MCSGRRWLTKAALISLALCPFLRDQNTLAEDIPRQPPLNEAKQFREQGHYAEAEKAHLLALAEAEKFVPENSRLASSLNNLARLYLAQGCYPEVEPTPSARTQHSEKERGNWALPGCRCNSE